jgi:glutathione S-transferase
MILADEQVATREVKGWSGLHLLHFSGSSCSQKVRILLGEKQLPWISHHVNLGRNAHVSPWFLGINPRGVVPVLVHDGQVHVESNDILEYLDSLPSPATSFMPLDGTERETMRSSLVLEDSLHTDLRNLTMGFIYPRRLTQKTEQTLLRYEREGAENPSRMKEVRWWRDFARQGVTEDAARASCLAFGKAFAVLNARLGEQTWLIGGRISILDIAWFISVHRLRLAGYPLSRHPHVLAWYDRLRVRPAFAREIATPLPVAGVMMGYRLYRIMRRTTLARVCFFVPNTTQGDTRHHDQS